MVEVGVGDIVVVVVEVGVVVVKVVVGGRGGESL
jgi:hypothetical protein